MKLFAYVLLITAHIILSSKNYLAFILFLEVAGVYIKHQHAVSSKNKHKSTENTNI